MTNHSTPESRANQNWDKLAAQTADGRLSRLSESGSSVVASEVGQFIIQLESDSEGNLIGLQSTRHGGELHVYGIDPDTGEIETVKAKNVTWPLMALHNATTMTASPDIAWESVSRPV